jgi:hypothetical protein
MYLWMGSITFPSLSEAFLISKIASKEANAIHIAENAMYHPGQMLKMRFSSIQKVASSLNIPSSKTPAGEWRITD